MRIGLQTSIANAIALGTAGAEQDGELDLARIPWEGGPDYYTVAQNGTKMTSAEASGWNEDTFFPIAVFLTHPNRAADLLDLGINTMMALDAGGGGGGTPADGAAAGIFMLPQWGEWTTGEVNAAGNFAVGWFVNDEPEMLPNQPDDQFLRLADQQADVAAARAINDGRFMFTNFGNGVLRTFWSPDTMDEYVQDVDACCVDKYPYTSPQVRFEYGRTPDWTAVTGLTNDTQPNRDASQASAAYGWQLDQMRTFDNPSSRRPIWFFVETKMPFLGESGADIILYDEIEGAVWSGIAHEARGISYFQQNGFYPGGLPVNDPNTGSAHCGSVFSLFDCEVGLQTRITQINSRITELAPVLNTQSYVFDFGAVNIDTMLKAKDGFAYIFASVGVVPTLGSKTFTLTGSGITGTSVEVLYESRTLTVTGGQFTDTFAQEYTHHIYKVAI